MTRIRGSWLLAFALLVAATACGSGAHRAATTTTPRAPSTTTSTTSTTPPTTVATPPVNLLPLYPFTSLAEAAEWQRNFDATRPGQPFLDAGKTAVAFAHYLGYTGIDRVVSVAYDAQGAHAGVGFAVGTNTRTAAVVHLIKYGSGSHVPWEVVGTDDTDFTIDVPGYGAAITSPLRVRGRITGVDESIAVVVEQPHANGYLGRACCVAAGGDRAGWTILVSFAPSREPVLLVSAATGGHVEPVERFTVTGVRFG